MDLDEETLKHPFKKEYANSGEVVVQFDDVNLGYGSRTILSDLNLKVRKGQIVALIGGSGSGKSTILRGVSGQIIAQKGKVTLFDQDLSLLKTKALQNLRKNMGVLFQQGALFTDLNVFENVAFPLRELTSLNEKEILERVLDKLNRVGLKSAAHLDVSEISGGMARRIALARAIIMEPGLILYDEPFSGLDPVSLGVIATLIRELSNQLDCGALLITHDIEESFRIVDYVYMIGQGGIVCEGTPDELIHTQDEEVQRFIKGLPAQNNAFEYPITPNFENWLKEKQDGLRGSK